MAPLVSLIANMFSSAGRATMTAARGAQQSMARASGVVKKAAATQAPTAAKMPGMSASQKMAMMGNSPAQIATANATTQYQQAQAARNNQPSPASVAANSAKELLGALGPATFGLGTLAAVGIGANLAIKHWTESVLDSGREMGKFNGKIAMAYARLDAKDFRLNLDAAGKTSGSTEHLVQHFAALKSEFQPIRVALTTMANLTATVIVDHMRSMIKMLENAPFIGGDVKKIIEALKVIEERLGSKGHGNTADIELLFKMAQGVNNGFEWSKRTLPPLR